MPGGSQQWSQPIGGGGRGGQGGHSSRHSSFAQGQDPPWREGGRRSRRGRGFEEEFKNLKGKFDKFLSEANALLAAGLPLPVTALAASQASTLQAPPMAPGPAAPGTSPPHGGSVSPTRSLTPARPPLPPEPSLSDVKKQISAWRAFKRASPLPASQEHADSHIKILQQQLAALTPLPARLQATQQQLERATADLERRQRHYDQAAQSLAAARQAHQEARLAHEQVRAQLSATAPRPATETRGQQALEALAAVLQYFGQQPGQAPLPGQLQAQIQALFTPAAAAAPSERDADLTCVSVEDEDADDELLTDDPYAGQATLAPQVGSAAASSHGPSGMPATPAPATPIRRTATKPFRASGFPYARPAGRDHSPSQGSVSGQERPRSRSPARDNP